VKRGTMCGDWRVLDRIGGGGNGDVYRCKGQDGAEAAIKVLKRGRDRRHDRMPRLSSFKKTSKTEGIVTELSRYRELFVIARNSSFQ